MVGALPDVSGDDYRNINSDRLIISALRLNYMIYYAMVGAGADLIPFMMILTPTKSDLQGAAVRSTRAVHACAFSRKDLLSFTPSIRGPRESIVYIRRQMGCSRRLSP